MSQKLLVEVFKNSDLKTVLHDDKAPEGMMVVEGVFGRVDSENRNKRFYPKDEYSKHVKLMQERISESNGVFGEMEHPKSMNIDYNNISHKITSIRIDEDGFVRGTVLLLDTPKGKIAQSIVRSGSPLGISSRAVGNVHENGAVKLNFLSTYDLVGTSGFAEAQLYESICESVDIDGTIVSEMFEHDIDDAGNAIASSTMQGIVEAVETRLRKNFVAKDDVNQMISEALQSRQLNESEETDETQCEIDESRIVALMNTQFADVYSHIIEKWVTTEFAPEQGQAIQEWLVNDYSTLIESWATKELAPKLGESIQEWLVNDYAEVLESWVKNDALVENAKHTETWIIEQFAPKLGESIQEWLTNDYAEVLESLVKPKLNVPVQTIAEAQEEKPVEIEEEEGEEETVKDKTDEVTEAAKLFTSKLLENVNEDIVAANNLKVVQQAPPARVDESHYKMGPAWLRNIPAEYKPLWESLNNDQRAQVYRKASIRIMETFGDVKRFWGSVDFQGLASSHSAKRERAINESFSTQNKNINNGLVAMSKALRSN